MYNWWQSIYILLSIGRSRVLMVTKCSYMIETFYEAPHWGFITGILHKHNVKTKVNQLSKIKITQSQCHLDVWIKDKKWITLKQKMILNEFCIWYQLWYSWKKQNLHIAIVNSFIASQTQKTLNMLLPGIWANM